jgi:hypothetical protein
VLLTTLSMVVLKQRFDQFPLLIRQVRWVGFVRHRASSWTPLSPYQINNRSTSNLTTHHRENLARLQLNIL